MECYVSKATFIDNETPV